MKKGKLIVILGQSGSGKTTLANEVILTGVILFDNKTLPHGIAPWEEEYPKALQELTTDLNNTSFYARKYVTRDIRKDDVGVIHATKEEMDKVCDVVLSGYKENDYYGFNTKEIINQIDNGKYPVIVTGFMQTLQLLLRRFYELGRLEDIYVVGIRSLLYDLDHYNKLEQNRYGKENINEHIRESAKRRFEESRLLARQYYYFGGMESETGVFDYVVKNIRFKYGRDIDLRKEGSFIYNIASRFDGVRTKEQLDKIMELIHCNLNEFTPVQEDEIKRI